MARRGLIYSDNEIRSRQPAFSRAELAIILALWGVPLVLLLPALERERNPKGPHGETIPTGPPIESNRITHATGLSIIAPVNWDQLLDFRPDTPNLQIAARGAPARRLESIIRIELCEPIPDEQTLASCRQVQFQGAQAYEKMQVDREYLFDDPAESSYDLYIERDGLWWHANFYIAARMTELPNAIRQYLETVKFPQTPH